MRVVLISGAHEYSGAERYAVTLVEALAGDVRFTAVVPRGAPTEFLSRLAEAGAEVASVPGLQQRPTAIGLAATVATLRRLQADVVHVNLTFQGDGLVPLLAARACGLPLVATLHNVVPKRSRMKERVARRALRAPDRVIAVSEAVASSSRDCTVVHNGIPPPRLTPGARRLLGLPEHGLVVGGIGRLHHQKGWDVLARAAGHLGGVTVAVIGDGEERSRLEGTPLRLLGYRQRASAYLPAFNVLAMPSRYEGFGLAALEAMHAGVPVVASAVGGIPEVVGDAGVLVEPEEADQLARALSDLLADPVRRAELARRGRERSQRLFSVERMARSTLAVYASL